MSCRMHVPLSDYHQIWREWSGSEMIGGGGVVVSGAEVSVHGFRVFTSSERVTVILSSWVFMFI
jgi:hypothetical protein